VQHHAVADDRQRVNLRQRARQPLAASVLSTLPSARLKRWPHTPASFSLISGATEIIFVICRLTSWETKDFLPAPSPVF
jgi:hypothetical protein